MQRKLCNIMEDNTGISNLQVDVLREPAVGNAIGSCSSSNLDEADIASLLTPDICLSTSPWLCSNFEDQLEDKLKYPKEDKFEYLQKDKFNVQSGKEKEPIKEIKAKPWKSMP